MLSQTYYPNLQTYLHGYIRHIRDILQLCLLTFLLLELGVEQIFAILAEFTGISFLNRRQTLQLFL